jgi:hypothetical protein
MTLHREFPHPINAHLQALEQLEPELYCKSNPTLCGYAPNLLIDALILNAIRGPKSHRLVGHRSLFIGNSWDIAAPITPDRLNPNRAQRILLKSIGIPAGVVLGEPYQGLIVAVPDDPSIANQGVFVNRIWNDYPMKHHRDADALSNEIEAPVLSRSQKEAYWKHVSLLTQEFTWASQAFLHLLESQLGICIPEHQFAVSRRRSVS